MGYRATAAIVATIVVSGCAANSGSSRDEIRAYIDEVNKQSSGDSRETAGATIEALVQKAEPGEEVIVLDLDLKNTHAEAVAGVIVETISWTQRDRSYVRGPINNQTIPGEIASGAKASVVVREFVPDSLPGPVSFVSIRARPLKEAERALEDQSVLSFTDRTELGPELLLAYMALPGVGVASLDGKTIFSRLRVTNGSISSAGQVLKIRGKIQNMYSEEVQGVHYRIRFLDRASADARVLGTERLQRHGLRLEPGQRRALSIEAESMYIAVGNVGFVVEAWPMKIGDTEIALPDGW